VKTPECASNCADGSPFYKSSYYFAKTYLVKDQAEAIMSDIYSNGPVEACFEVYEDFVHYKSGVYRHTKGADLGGTCGNTC
jgi:cathepsin B